MRNLRRHGSPMRASMFWNPALVERVPRDTFFPLPALLDECLDRGEAVGAFPIEEEWIDVGHPKELRRARGEENKP